MNGKYFFILKIFYFENFEISEKSENVGNFEKSRKKLIKKNEIFDFPKISTFFENVDAFLENHFFRPKKYIFSESKKNRFGFDFFFRTKKSETKIYVVWRKIFLVSIWHILSACEGTQGARVHIESLDF